MPGITPSHQLASSQNSRLLSSTTIHALFPPERVNQVLHVFLKKVVYRAKRVLFRLGIKLQSTTKKMTGRICGKKLVSRSGISFQGEINTMYSIGGNKWLRLNT